MSFMMDMLNTATTTGEEGRDASLLGGDGIELPSMSSSGVMIVEEEANTPQLLTSKSRSRLVAVGASIMLAVMLLGGMASHWGGNNSNNSPKNFYQQGTTALNPAAHAVAQKPVFRKPTNNMTQHSSPSFLPFYTMQHVVTSPYSPQAKALDWVEQYPHFKAIRRWRKRQLFALATFFYSTGGNLYWQDDAKRDWLSTALHECNWKGDTMFDPDCSKRSLKGRYQRLEVGFNNLQGTLPPELAMLSALNHLELYGNDHLVGSIPSQIGKVTTLKDMNLYNNQLNGKLPTTLGQLTRLSALNLDHNALTGTLPSQLGLLTSMVRLHLADNELTGTIPSVLKQLSNLQMLSLQGNPGLNGTVSPSICYFKELEKIWVDCATVKCPCAQCVCAEDHGAEIEPHYQASQYEYPHTPQPKEEESSSMKDLEMYKQHYKYPHTPKEEEEEEEESTSATTTTLTKEQPGLAPATEDAEATSP